MFSQDQIDAMMQEEKALQITYDEWDAEETRLIKAEENKQAQVLILDELFQQYSTGEPTDVGTIRVDLEADKADILENNPPWWDISEPHIQPMSGKSIDEEVAKQILANPYYENIYDKENDNIMGASSNAYYNHVINRAKEFQTLQDIKYQSAQNLVMNGYSAAEAYSIAKEDIDAEFTNLQPYAPSPTEQAYLYAQEGQEFRAAASIAFDPWVILGAGLGAAISTPFLMGKAGLSKLPYFANVFSKQGAGILANEYAIGAATQPLIDQAFDLASDQISKTPIAATLAVALVSGVGIGVFADRLGIEMLQTWAKEPGSTLTSGSVARKATAIVNKMVRKGEVDPIAQKAISNMVKEIVADATELSKTTGDDVRELVANKIATGRFTSAVTTVDIKRADTAINDMAKLVESHKQDVIRAEEGMREAATFEVDMKLGASKVGKELDSAAEQTVAFKKIQAEEELQASRTALRASISRLASLDRSKARLEALMKGIDKTKLNMGEVPIEGKIPDFDLEGIENVEEIFAHFGELFPDDPVAVSTFKTFIRDQVRLGTYGGAEAKLTAEDIKYIFQKIGKTGK